MSVIDVSGFLHVAAQVELADPGSVVGWVQVAYEDEGAGLLLSFPNASLVEVVVDASQVPPPASFADVVEVSASGMAVLENDTGDAIEIGDVPGETPIRLRLGVDDVDGDRPRLMIQWWPAPLAGPSVVRESAEVDGDRPWLADLSIPEAVAGLRGASRVGEAIDADRPLDQIGEQSGVARAETVVEGVPAHLTAYFNQARVWTPDEEGLLWRYLPRDGDDTARMRNERHPDRLAGWRGALVSRPHPDDTPPGRRVARWNWLLPDDGSERVDETCRKARAYLPTDTLRCVFLEQVPGEKQTRIRVEHAGLPLGWVDDMSSWWLYQLTLLARNPVPIKA